MYCEGVWAAIDAAYGDAAVATASDAVVATADGDDAMLIHSVWKRGTEWVFRVSKVIEERTTETVVHEYPSPVNEGVNVILPQVSWQWGNISIGRKSSSHKSVGKIARLNAILV